VRRGGSSAGSAVAGIGSERTSMLRAALSCQAAATHAEASARVLGAFLRSACVCRVLALLTRAGHPPESHVIREVP
jgi:hypothetical protein